jgi:hypothetical protein
MLRTFLSVSVAGLLLIMLFPLAVKVIYHL